MSARASTRLPGPAALLALLAAVIVAAELIARALLSSQVSTPVRKVAVPGAERPAAAAAFVPDDDAIVADPDLLWRNRPSFERTLPVLPSPPVAAGGTPAQWTLKTNASGFRASEPTAAAAGEDLYRILCIGDSVTQGFNVDQGSDYPAVLERLLAERHPAAKFEVLNAAVAEWSWVQGSAWLLHEGFALRPDLVIAAFGTADQSDAIITDSERIWLLAHPGIRRSEERSALLARSALWRLLFATPAPARAGPQQASPGCRLQEAAGGDCRRVPLVEISASVHRIGEAVKAAGVDVLIVNLDFGASAAAAAARLAAIRDGMLFVDHVAKLKTDWLHDEMGRSRDAGLAWPRVPLVPFGRIGLPAPEGRGVRVRFRLRDPAGRTDLRVAGRGPEGSGFVFDQAMRDDGAGGDEKAGDAVYSAEVEAPTGVTTLRYQYEAAGVPEFGSIPAGIETNADRRIRFNRDSDVAIEIFAERPLMSDALHPNAEGHAAIAAALLPEIEKMSTFARVAAAGRR